MARASLARSMSLVEGRLRSAVERIRPAMQMDGGDIALVGWDEASGVARVSLSGACAGCSNIQTTTMLGVQRVLKQLVPEVRAVETV